MPFFIIIFFDLTLKQADYVLIPVFIMRIRMYYKNTIYIYLSLLISRFVQSFFQEWGICIENNLLTK
jgi:hypothetical protein